MLEQLLSLLLLKVMLWKLQKRYEVSLVRNTVNLANRIYLQGPRLQHWQVPGLHDRGRGGGGGHHRVPRVRAERGGREQPRRGQGEGQAVHGGGGGRQVRKCDLNSKTHIECNFNRNYCSHGDYVNNNDEIMEMMACGAVEHNMYMVVNIGEMVDCGEQEVSECSTWTSHVLNNF